jgi:hypothetical protein
MVSLVITVEPITLIIIVLILVVVIAVVIVVNRMGGFAEMALKMSSVNALPMGLAPQHLEAICLETRPTNLSMDPVEGQLLKHPSLL